MQTLFMIVLAMKTFASWRQPGILNVLRVPVKRGKSVKLQKHHVVLPHLMLARGLSACMCGHLHVARLGPGCACGGMVSVSN